MPAVITHDTFGRDIYDSLHEAVGSTRDELQAFLLGNQGPDVLFFGALDPRTIGAPAVGVRMHRERTAELLAAFRCAVDDIAPGFAMPTDAGGNSPTASARRIGRAYAMGLLCHYLLDSGLHPFIYAQQWELCDAGVPGLDRACAHEVHATIESELDELVLSTKHGCTIASFDPSHKTLAATDHVLNVVGALYRRVAQQVYDERLSQSAVRICAKAYRTALRALWSPSGAKREVLTALEHLFREHSLLRAMSHQDRPLYASQFDNAEHREWRDPATGALSTASFWDLYDAAARRARADVVAFADTDDACAFTRTTTAGLNFNGEPTEATIIATTTLA